MYAQLTSQFTEKMYYYSGSTTFCIEENGTKFFQGFIIHTDF